jgi:adenosylhomocysteine nucleosidase
MRFSRHGYGPVGRPANPPVGVLVCFALEEEAKFFNCQSQGGIQAWVTGVGARNAAQGIRDAIARARPARVITAGFAGGLNPGLKTGDVVYEQDADAGFARELEQWGAVPGRFHCHPQVVVTAAEKAALWRETGADAVEMESSVIRALCRESKVPSATVRVILDDARQDLPLDFNALMTPDDRIHYRKLAWAVMGRPGSIAALMRFRRQTLEAARKLGGVLGALLGVRGN